MSEQEPERKDLSGETSNERYLLQRFGIEPSEVFGYVEIDMPTDADEPPKQ